VGFAARVVRRYRRGLGYRGLVIQGSWYPGAVRGGGDEDPQVRQVRAGLLDQRQVGLVGDERDRAGVAEKLRHLRGGQPGVQRDVGEARFMAAAKASIG
jgi:hypothetical protein